MSRVASGVVDDPPARVGLEVDVAALAEGATNRDDVALVDLDRPRTGA